MLGNVWEWVDDYYNEKLFADRKPPSKGNQHVLKGASFVGDVKNATYMTHAGGPGNGWDVGFRIVKDAEDKMIKLINILLFFCASLGCAYAQMPSGFERLFNGKDLNQWHTSRTSHQGTVGNFYVENGAITLKHIRSGREASY